MSTATTQASIDASLPADLPRGLLIGGEWVDGTRGHIDVENPATGQPLAQVADADVAQGLAALDAAVAVAADWAATPPRQRAELLRRAFEAVIARTDDFARLMTLEMGKPLAEARGEVAYGAEFLRWFSEEAPRITGTYRSAPEGTSRQLVVRRPVGPCLLITPWNFPLAMATRKVARPSRRGARSSPGRPPSPRSPHCCLRSCSSTADCPRASSTSSRARATT